MQAMSLKKPKHPPPTKQKKPKQPTPNQTPGTKTTEQQKFTKKPHQTDKVLCGAF